MSYYPILSAPYCTGQTTLYNFSPNNWEMVYKGEQYINLSYIKNSTWHSQVLDSLDYDAYKTIAHQDLSQFVPLNTLALLSLTQKVLPKTSQTLPKLSSNKTLTPAYRSTLELKSQYAQTSYQGELDPFPPQASLLTFSPFLQFGDGIENFVLILNIEKSPQNRESKIEIYDANSKALKSVQTAYSNQINHIHLNNLGFDKQSLPVVICRTMAAIPLYFSCTNQGQYLSLEHTHPPASLVVHGRRFGAQKQLKQYWFSRLQNNGQSD